MGASVFELLKAKRRVKELEGIVVGLEEQLKSIPPPLMVGEITSSLLMALLLETFPQLEYDLVPQAINLADRKYKFTTLAEMNRFLAKDDTDKMTWQKEAPDCDDFTRRILGNLTIPGWWSLAKGDIWIYGEGWGHSIVVTLLCESQTITVPAVYLIEGQTDAMELAPEMFEDFKVRLIKI